MSRSQPGADAVTVALIGALDVEGDHAPRAVARQLAARPGILPFLVRAARTHPSPRTRRWLVEALGFTRDRRALVGIRRALAG